MGDAGCAGRLVRRLPGPLGARVVGRLVHPPHLGHHLRLRRHLAIPVVPRVARLRHGSRPQPLLLDGPLPSPGHRPVVEHERPRRGDPARPGHLALRARGHPQRGLDARPGALGPLHVLAAAAVGPLGSRRLPRRPGLRLLPVRLREPGRRPPDGRRPRPAPVDGGLPRRPAGAPAPPAGRLGGGVGAAAHGPVLRGHRGPGHGRGHDRRRHRARRGLRRRLRPRRARRPRPARPGRPGGGGGRVRRAARLPGLVRPGRAGPPVRSGLAEDRAGERGHHAR